MMQGNTIPLHTDMEGNRKERKQGYLRPGSNVVSADNMAATVKAWDKQPYSFASSSVLDKEGSSGSSAQATKVSEKRHPQ